MTTYASIAKALGSVLVLTAGPSLDVFPPLLMTDDVTDGGRM